MTPPPTWVRRLFIDPLIVVGVVLAAFSLPVWILVALFVSRLVPGRWRIFALHGSYFSTWPWRRWP